MTASLPALYDELLYLNSDFDKRLEFFNVMMNSEFEEVRQVAQEMTAAEGSKSDAFRAPLGELFDSLLYMQEPAIYKSLEKNSDFSLNELVRTDKKVKVNIIIPAQYLEICKPLVRVLLGSPVQQKAILGGSHRIAVNIDEAGQLGYSPSIKSLYTFDRTNAEGVCAWQEIDQLYEAFGEKSGNAIVSSALVKSFAGVRTKRTADLVSSLSGVMNLEYDDKRHQAEAKFARQQVMQAALNGGNIMETAIAAKHHRANETRKSHMPREVFKPDEVLNHKGSINFAGELASGVFTGMWPRYYQVKKLNGIALNNPYYGDTVAIKGVFGTKHHKIITEACPSSLEHLPQYSSSYWRYVEGHRPRVGR